MGRSEDGGATAPVLPLPRRRVLWRFGLPGVLVAGFAVALASAAWDALIPATAVQVTVPIPAAAGGAGAAAGAEGGNAREPAAARGGNAVEATGYIEPWPWVRQIAALSPGLVTAIHVHDGSDVTTGQLVAELHSRDAELELAAASAERQLREAELASAERSLAHPLALDQEIARERGEVGRLRAESERLEKQAQSTRARNAADRELAGSGAGGQLAAELSRLEVSAAEAALRETAERIAATSATLAVLMERRELLVDERNAVDRARAALALAGAQESVAREHLNHYRVVAPVAGRVLRVQASEGKSLSTDQEGGLVVATLYHPRQLQARADVPVAQAAGIAPGQAAEVTAESHPGRTFHGIVDRVVPEADMQRQIVSVRVRLEDAPEDLYPQTVCRVRLLGREAPAAEPRTESRTVTRVPSSPPGALLVEESAFVFAAEEGRLWLAEEGRRARRIEVTAGPGPDGLRLVTAGLRPTDKPVTASERPLRDGMRVRIEEGAADGK